LCQFHQKCPFFKPTELVECIRLTYFILRNIYLLTELSVDTVSSLATEGGPPSATSDLDDWLPAIASPWRLSEVVVAMLLGGDDRGSESESSSLSSSGQSSRAVTFVCLPFGPLTHVVCGSLRSDVSRALRVTSYKDQKLNI